MAQLDHPHILRVYDIGHHNGRDYVVMALAERGSLADRVDAHGPMAPEVALASLVQTLSALHAAHVRGIVHRDVKPQNLLIGEDGRALLADFGIALLAEDQLRTTRTGVAMGSLAYMAPEQRLDARSVTPAADIYAAGTTLYNLLTAANPVDLFTAGADSSRWAGIPEPIAAVIRRAVCYAPADRYRSARELAAELQALLPRAGSEPLPPPPDAPRLPGWEETHPAPASLPPHPQSPPARAVDAAHTSLALDEEPPPRRRPPPWLPWLGIPVLAALATGLLLLLEPSPVEATVEAEPPTAPPEQDPAERGPVEQGPASNHVEPAEVAAAGSSAAGSSAAGSSAAGSSAAGSSAAGSSAAGSSAAGSSAAGSSAAGSSAAGSSAAGSSAAGSSAAGPSAAGPSAAELSSASSPPDSPEPAAHRSTLAGTWRGNAHANQASLVLSGSSSDLRGTMTTTRATTGVSVSVEVSARLDADGTVLRVEELDREAPGAGTYTLRLSADGSRLEGSFRSSDGSRRFPVVLDRVGA